MEKFENKEENRDEVFSVIVRAGRRKYFLDVKKTKEDELYLTVTESKRFTDEEGKFFYQKHKIFLYKEDFEKFVDGLHQVIEFIETNQKSVKSPQTDMKNNFTNVDFDDLKIEKE